MERGYTMENKKKLLIQICISIGIFLCFFGLLGSIFKFSQPSLLSFLSDHFKSKPSSFEYKEVFPYIAGTINIIISAIVTAYVKLIIETKDKIPRILIMPCQKNSISGIKKEKHMKFFPHIKIGIANDGYRIIYAKIKNIGKSIISECMIENQLICQGLFPGQSSELYIILYDSSDDGMFIKKEISYSIQDIKNINYIGKYFINVDLERGNVLFQISKKIKKENKK